MILDFLQIERIKNGDQWNVVYAVVEFYVCDRRYISPFLGYPRDKGHAVKGISVNRGQYVISTMRIRTNTNMLL